MSTNSELFGSWHPMETAPRDGSPFVVRSLYTSDVYDDDVYDDEVPVERGVREEVAEICQWFSIGGLPGGDFMTIPFHRQPTNRAFTGWTPLPPLMPSTSKYVPAYLR